MWPHTLILLTKLKVISECRIISNYVLLLIPWKYWLICAIKMFKKMSQYMCCVLKSLSCLWLCDTIDCSLPGSSVHGISQARILQWVAISFSRGSSQPRDQTQVSYIAGRHFTVRATRKAQHPLDHWKTKRVPEKHLFLPYWLCQSLWLCGSQQTVENSSRDGNTRPPDLPLGMQVRKQQLELDMEQQTGSK